MSPNLEVHVIIVLNIEQDPYTVLLTSVVDPHHFYSDPDPNLTLICIQIRILASK